MIIMKNKKMISAVLCIVIMLGVLTACGKTPAEEPVGMPNPLKEVSGEQMAAITGLALVAPEGASGVKYFTINDKTAQLVFTLDGREYTYRAEPTGELKAYDLSGMYYDWTETGGGKVGYCDAVVETCDKAAAAYWLDIVPGINYSLGCSAQVTADELLKVANACFVPVQGDVDGKEPASVKEVGTEEMIAASGLELAAPEGAANVKYYIVNGTAAQVVFTLDNRKFTYRATRTGELEAFDFSDLYYNWEKTSEAPVDYLNAKVKTCKDAAVAYWLDIVPGVNYTLSCESAISAEELMKVANMCFVPTQGDA